jgi:hypothetical protein
MPTADFVAGLFRGILGREPQPAGSSHYVRALGHGRGPEEVVRSILDSEEAALRRLRTAREPLWAARAAGIERPLCFLHLLKTGGTALVSSLRRLLPPELCLTGLYLDHLVAVPRYALDGAAVIAGHLPYEAAELLPARAAMCTVLRDPVDRTLSHYSHLSRHPDVRRHHPDLSLEQYLRAPEWQGHARNHQARRLVLQIGVTGAWRDFSPRERLESLGWDFSPDFPTPLDALLDRAPLDLPDDELQRRATDRLGSIELVGVTERLDDLFQRAANLLGITDPPPLVRENVGSNRVRRADLPTELVDTILEQNAVDLALYQRAVALQGEIR